MSGDAIHAAEQRCLRLVTLAENQAKEQRKTLQGEIKRLNEEKTVNEEDMADGTKRGSRALESYSQQLADAVKMFDTRHREFTNVIHHVATVRAEQESRAVSSMKDAVSDFYRNLTGARKKKFLNTMKAVNLGNQLARSTVSAVEDEEDVPFSMQAVMQYLVGAVEALERQSQNIVTEVKALLDNETLNRKGYLLSEEREMFQRTIKKMASPFITEGVKEATGSPVRSSVPGSPMSSSLGSPSRVAQGRSDLDIVSPQALEVILCQRLYDARETRHQTCLEILANASRKQTESLSNAFEVADAKMSGIVTALSETPLAVSVQGHGDSFSPEPAQQPQAVGGWGKLKGKGVAGVLRQRDPLLDKVAPQPQRAVGLANVVAKVVAGKRGTMPPSTMSGYHHGGDGIQVGGGRVEDIKQFVHIINQMEDHIISKVVEQHVEDYAAIHGEYATQMETLTRHCFKNKELQIYQTTTVFSIDSLKAELAHRELVSRVMAHQEQQLRDKFEDELRRLNDVVVNLQSENSKLRRELADMQNLLDVKDREIQTLQTVASERSTTDATQLQLKQDVRIVHYEVNSKSFGESWQESLLKLRERILSELQNDNLRFIARINTLVKRQRGDETQLEQLYEARTNSIVRELENDNKYKMSLILERHKMEQKRIAEEWRARNEDTKANFDEELLASKAQFREKYEVQCQELNEMYDAKVRQLQCQREENEAYFERKIVLMRQDTRDKEMAIDSRAGKRFAEMNAHFEQLSDDLRKRYGEREKQLDRERLLVQANFESKVNDKVMQVRADMDVLRQKLEETVLKFITQQRRSFEQYREKEMTNFAMYGQVNDRLARQRNQHQFRDQVKLNESAIQELRLTHQEEFALYKSNTESNRELQAKDFEARLCAMKDNQEEVLKVTQDLRIEQDEQMWNECHNEVIAANRLLIDEKSRLDLLLQSRYSSLIMKCQEYLQNDIRGARSAFESEQKVRVAHFHNYCIYYHQIQLRLEQGLWAEQSERHLAEKEWSSEFFALKVRASEEKRNIAFCEMLDGNPFAPIGVITVDELRTIREDYETRLLDKQRLISNVTKDSISGLETHMRVSHGQLVSMENGFSVRLEDITTTLQEKFKAYYSVRSFIVEDEIRRVAEFAESVVTNAIKGTGAIVRGVSNVVVVGGDGDKSPLRAGVHEGGVVMGDGGAHWSEDVRVMEYFVSMKQVLSQAMQEYEEKLEDKFEDSERQKRDTFHRMHVEYLNASGHLMKQLEGLKITNDFAEISLQQAKTRLTLQSNEHNKAKLLCDDLVALLEANNNTKMLRVKGLAAANAKHPGLTGATSSVAQQLRQAGKNGGNMVNGELDVVVPLSTLADLAHLRERLYCDEYTLYAKGQIISSLEHEAAEREKDRDTNARFQAPL